jgi:cyclic beta-1,2-glucan synthetase
MLVAVFFGGKGNLGQQTARLAALEPFEKDLTFENQAEQYPDVKISLPQYIFKCGIGGFLSDGSFGVYLEQGRATPMPYSNVLANENFGSIVTERGGGYTWAKNSRENKLTSWKNDPITDGLSEGIYIRDEETGAVCSPFGRLKEKGCFVQHAQGYSVFTCGWQGLQVRLTVFVDREKSVKCYLLEAKNLSQRERALSVTGTRLGS